MKWKEKINSILCQFVDLISLLIKLYVCTGSSLYDFYIHLLNINLLEQNRKIVTTQMRHHCQHLRSSWNICKFTVKTSVSCVSAITVSDSWKVDPFKSRDLLSERHLKKESCKMALKSDFFSHILWYYPIIHFLLKMEHRQNAEGRFLTTTEAERSYIPTQFALAPSGF